MQRNNGTRPVAKSETGPPTAEHRKATRDGTIALYAALALLVIAVVAGLAGFTAVAATSGGISVALVVIGLLLHFEGERQRQRPDPSGPRPAE
jgi:uncharacterized membrane protein YtjA (UPF0391 family)